MNRFRSPLIRFVSVMAVHLLALDAARAQKVDLQGTIRDRYTAAPVPEARVTLVGLGLDAATDSAGRFRILQVPTGMPDGNASMRLHPTGRRSLAFRCGVAGEASLRLLDLSGQEMLRSRFLIPEAGDWEIEFGALPPGLYFARLEGPSFRHSARLALIAGGEGSPRAVAWRRLNSGAPLAKAAAAIDTLRVARPGYHASSFPVAALEESGLEFVLSDTTVSMGRLVALAVSAGALQPPFDPAVLAYKVAVPESVDAIRITPDASPANPIIHVNGDLVASGSPSSPLPLVVGAHFVNVQVVSRDSSATSVYRLEIHRGRLDYAALGSLTLSRGTLSPAFHPEVLAYTASLPNGTSAVRIDATPFQSITQVILGDSLQRPISNPVIVDPVPRTLTLRAITESPGKVVERVYTLALTRAEDVPPHNGPVATLAYTPALPYLKPFRLDSTWQTNYLESKDSVLDLT